MLDGIRNMVLNNVGKVQILLVSVIIILITLIIVLILMKTGVIKSKFAPCPQPVNMSEYKEFRASRGPNAVAEADAQINALGNLTEQEVIS